MNCYHCGCELSEKDFCTACGADVASYKRIIYASNRYYNEGLEKAAVRDLSGAVTSLRQSLRFYKGNIEARNLLGLVYYELGEAVRGLGEWVISQNFRPQKNIASDYIKILQDNPAQLDIINQSVKKYNTALMYCHQDSLDLAVIQLKAVLRQNPRFLAAHQLLALLYMNDGDWEKARKELEKCRRVDFGNTTTRRYLKETAIMLEEKEKAGGGKRKKGRDKDIKTYKSGNDIVIMPADANEKKGLTTAINIAIGAIIGVAIAVFLILPAQISSAGSVVQEELKTVSEQLDKKTAGMEELNQQIARLQEENSALNEQLNNNSGEGSGAQAVDSLLEAVNAYMSDGSDSAAVKRAFEEIGGAGENESQAFQMLYQRLLSEVGPAIAKDYYVQGQDSLKKEMFTDAVITLEKAVSYDPENGDIMYEMGNAYRQSGEKAKAAEAYKRVIELLPNTEKASRAEKYLGEL